MIVPQRPTHRRASSRRLLSHLLAGAALLATAFLPLAPASAAAPRQLEPFWDAPAVLASPMPRLPDEVVGSRAGRQAGPPRAIEVANLAAESATAPLSFGGQRSNLPWASGSTGDETFGTWRGRAQDIHVIFSGRESWDSIRRVPGFSTTRRYASRARVSLGLAMLTNDQRGNFAGCAAGINDEHIRAVARGLVANGAGNSVVRLGWEMNGKGFPWSVGAFADLTPLYRDCFIRLATIIRAEAPDVLIEWTPRRGTDPRLRLEALYPGDEYVDIIGLLYYDWWPASPTEEAWARNMVQRDKHGGPRGIGTWLEFAQDRGKPFAVAEWGIGKHLTMDPFDNPVFIRKMFDFFRDNAADLAYESYFNNLTHRLFTGEGKLLSASANSAATYLQLYRPTP